ncbi:erythromycin esterase-like protein [Pedobacter sp. UYP24]
MQKNVPIITLIIFLLSLVHNISSSQAQQRLPTFALGLPEADTAASYVSSVFEQKIPDSVQIIALGEVSHGNYGPIAYKTAMIKYLIKKKGFRKILFEQSDLMGLRTIRNYLNNSGRTDTTYISSWVRKGMFTQAGTSGYLDLFKWIKDYNLQYPKDMVEVMGFEIGTEKGAIDFILNNYIIPFDVKKSQSIIYKLNANISDADKIFLIQRWFGDNQLALKAHLSIQSFKWLQYYIKNAVGGVNYLKNRAVDTTKNSNVSNLHRDSLLAENVLFLSGKEKTIVSAHNAHVIRTQWKYMGTYLNQFFKGKYYVIATDFSTLASAEVVKKQTWEVPIYINLKIKSDPFSAASQILKNYGISNGIFFSQDLNKMKVGNATNVIDAYGAHLFLPSFEGSLDALVVFDNIFPNK